jgi:hypothetical protein
MPSLADIMRVKSFICYLTTIVMISNHSTAHGQQSMSKIDVVPLSIEMAKRIKDVVEPKYAGRSPSAYEIIGTRLLHCGVTYELMGKSPKTNPSQREQYLTASEIYFRVSFFLFNDTERMTLGIQKSTQDFIALKNNDRKLFYFLRNCQDFSEERTLQNAVQELFLKP